jgi:hypothetical protein
MLKTILLYDLDELNQILEQYGDTPNARIVRVIRDCSKLSAVQQEDGSWRMAESNFPSPGHIDTDPADLYDVFTRIAELTGVELAKPAI